MSPNKTNQDKGKGLLQIDVQHTTYQLPVLPLEPFLFYIRDHELYYTALHGPRYNEDAIFIDYHEWYLSANSSFYEYLKIIKAYRSLLQSINNHPVLIILPTGYVETCRFFNIFTYWKPYDTYIIHFVQKVIPDVHICFQDFLSYHSRFFTTTHQLQRIIPNTCLQTLHRDHNCTCHQLAHYDIHCKFLYTALQNSSRTHSRAQKRLDKQTNSDDDTSSSAASSSTPPKPEDFQDSQDPYEL